MIVDAFAGGIVSWRGETWKVMESRVLIPGPTPHKDIRRVLLCPLAWHVSHRPGSPLWRWVPLHELTAGVDGHGD